MCCLKSLIVFPGPLAGLRSTRRWRGTNMESSSFTEEGKGGGKEGGREKERERERERERARASEQH